MLSITIPQLSLEIFFISFEMTKFYKLNSYSLHIDNYIFLSDSNYSSDTMITIHITFYGDTFHEKFTWTTDYIKKIVQHILIPYLDICLLHSMWIIIIAILK